MFAVGSPAEAEAAATSHPCIRVPVSLVPSPPLALSRTVAVAAGLVRPAVGSAQVTARTLKSGRATTSSTAARTRKRTQLLTVCAARGHQGFGAVPLGPQQLPHPFFRHYIPRESSPASSARLEVPAVVSAHGYRAGTLWGYRGGTGGPGRWSPGSSGSGPGLSSDILGFGYVRGYDSGFGPLQSHTQTQTSKTTQHHPGGASSRTHHRNRSTRTGQLQLSRR